jgi:hypothetical protein
VDQPVIDPATGQHLYDRKVFEPSFTPGLDGSDGAVIHGDRVERVADIHDRANARTTTVYKRFGDDGRYKGEYQVDHEQIGAREDVVARTRRSTS